MLRSANPTQYQPGNNADYPKSQFGRDSSRSLN